MKLLERYHWPGNVRELENIIERATLFEEDTVLSVNSLPGILKQTALKHSRRNTSSLDQMSKNHIQEVLATTGGNKTQASKILGIDRSTLYRIMKTV